MRMLRLKGGGLLDPTFVGKGNETFFIRVWKSLSHFKNVAGKSERESKKKKKKKKKKKRQYYTYL